MENRVLFDDFFIRHMQLVAIHLAHNYILGLTLNICLTFCFKNEIWLNR